MFHFHEVFYEKIFLCNFNCNVRLNDMNLLMLRILLYTTLRAEFMEYFMPKNNWNFMINGNHFWQSQINNYKFRII